MELFYELQGSSSTDNGKGARRSCKDFFHGFFAYSTYASDSVILPCEDDYRSLCRVWSKRCVKSWYLVIMEMFSRPPPPGGKREKNMLEKIGGSRRSGREVFGSLDCENDATRVLGNRKWPQKAGVEIARVGERYFSDNFGKIGKSDWPSENRCDGEKSPSSRWSNKSGMQDMSSPSTARTFGLWN